MRHFCVWLGLLAGLGATLSALPGRAADKADPETIEKLVKQLSSGRFVEREKAQKQLEAIGLPALEALKKAAETGDPETKRRAGELAAKLEKQVLGAKVLAPSKVALSYKDAPLKDALADFSKKTGYALSLVDPENKLKDRKITVEIAETTFWEALDQFCAKAGLVEADPTEVPQQGQPGFPGILPGGGIQIQPGIIQIKPGIAPAPPIKALPPEKAPAIEKLNKAGALQFQVEAPVAKDQPAIAPAQKPVAQPAQRVRPARPIRVFPPQQQIGDQSNQIFLKDGKPATLPTNYVGAVRVRAMDSVQMFGQAGEKEMLVGLKVSPEPKIRWQQMVNVRVDKAVDDQDQKLAAVMAPAPGPGQPQFQQFQQIGFAGAFGAGGQFGFGGGFPVQGSVHQYIPIRLTKGEKASKSLKELTGSITATVLAEPEVHITADNVAKAAGKTFKGKEGGQIKINTFEEKDGLVTVTLEFEQPANVVPAGQGGIFQGGVGGFFPGGGVKIIPLPVPAPAPIQLPLPPAKAAPAPPVGKAFPGGAFQVQVAPAKVQVAAAQVAQVQVQIGGGGIAIGPGGIIGGAGPMGLELVDEKGKSIPAIGFNTQFRGGAPGGQFTAEHVLQFKLEKDQKPAKLVFKGSKSVNVEIPFTLMDVELP